MHKHISLSLLVAAGSLLTFACTEAEPEGEFRVASPAMSGAIFTTMPDGSRVNANLYPSKEDVHLDGGPGPNAPIDAAGLPEGDYYFQVTDPSGKELLSSDHISCRRVHINGSGVIDHVYAGMTWVKAGPAWIQQACQHQQGIDIDHGAEGAITVQLMPYDDTPNNGGVYKAWLTRVENYVEPEEGYADPASGWAPSGSPSSANVRGELWEPGSFHGFIPADSKTDNYKVEKKGKVCDPTIVTVKKFHDANVNGVQDAGEENVEGWEVYATDSLGIVNQYFTTAQFIATPGTMGIEENDPADSTVTASYLDGIAQSQYPSASTTVVFDVSNQCGGSNEVEFGNVGLGEIEACKVFDRNANGEQDADEPLIPGWGFVLTGTDILGGSVGPMETATDDSGCVTFGDLLPGSYTVTEVMPAIGGWSATGDVAQNFEIVSTVDGSKIYGSSEQGTYTNICTDTADFGTKGFWHNKNGLQEMDDSDIAYVNGLPPYAGPSDYFDDCDEPFDGSCADGPVPGVVGAWGETIAPTGSARAEISRFLVDTNAGADPREQLAQQLLAFIFNVRNYLGGTGAAIELPDGSYMTGGELIDDAIAAWQSGTAEEQHELQSLLDAFNNNDAVKFVPATPCAH